MNGESNFLQQLQVILALLGKDKHKEKEKEQSQIVIGLIIVLIFLVIWTAVGSIQYLDGVQPNKFTQPIYDHVAPLLFGQMPPPQPGDGSSAMNPNQNLTAMPATTLDTSTGIICGPDAVIMDMISKADGGTKLKEVPIEPGMLIGFSHTQFAQTQLADQAIRTAYADVLANGLQWNVENGTLKSDGSPFNIDLSASRYFAYRAALDKALEQASQSGCFRVPTESEVDWSPQVVDNSRGSSASPPSGGDWAPSSGYRQTNGTPTPFQSVPNTPTATATPDFNQLIADFCNASVLTLSGVTTNNMGPYYDTCVNKAQEALASGQALGDAQYQGMSAATAKRQTDISNAQAATQRAFVPPPAPKNTNTTISGLLDVAAARNKSALTTTGSCQSSGGFKSSWVTFYLPGEQDTYNVYLGDYMALHDAGSVNCYNVGFFPGTNASWLTFTSSGGQSFYLNGFVPGSTSPANPAQPTSPPPTVAPTPMMSWRQASINEIVNSSWMSNTFTIRADIGCNAGLVVNYYQVPFLNGTQGYLIDLSAYNGKLTGSCEGIRITSNPNSVSGSYIVLGKDLNNNQDWVLTQFSGGFGLP